MALPASRDEATTTVSVHRFPRVVVSAYQSRDCFEVYIEPKFMSRSLGLLTSWQPDVNWCRPVQAVYASDRRESVFKKQVGTYI